MRQLSHLNFVSRRIVLPLLMIIGVFLSAWNNDPVKKGNQKSKEKKIDRINVPASTLVINSCKLDVAQLKRIFQDDVRKMLIQFRNTENSKLVAVVYGLDKHNEVLTGPEYATEIPGTGVTIPDNAIFGNLELTRGQFKKVFGLPLGRHRRMDETKMEEIQLSPNAVLDRGHFVYHLTILGKVGLVGEPSNPSPPAKPCLDCDD